MVDASDSYGNQALDNILEAASGSLSSGMAIRAIVLKALTDPNVFHGFDQLKQIVEPALQNDTGVTDSAAILRTLDLFSYGTISDFLANEADYIRLSDAQLAKLRQLTVLSSIQEACDRNQDMITYQELGNKLNFSATANKEESMRKLEECAISCIYSDLVNLRVCQKSQTFRISTETGPPCRARDVRVSEIPNTIEALKKFQERIRSSSSELEATKMQVATTIKVNSMHQNSIQEQFDKVGGPQSYSSGSVRSLGGWDSRGVPMQGGSSARRQPKRSRGGIASNPFPEPHRY